MAEDMDKNKPQSGQYGQGQNPQGGKQDQGQQGQGQKSGQGETGQQNKGNVDPNKKNPSQNEQDDQDKQRRAS